MTWLPAVTTLGQGRRTPVYPGSACTTNSPSLPTPCNKRELGASIHGAARHEVMMQADEREMAYFKSHLDSQAIHTNLGTAVFWLQNSTCHIWLRSHQMRHLECMWPSKAMFCCRPSAGVYQKISCYMQGVLPMEASNDLSSVVASHWSIAGRDAP